MGKIVAIGGGEIGRPKKNGGFHPVETIAIDREIIRLSAKSKPSVLFIPTASHDSSRYFDVVKKHFGKRLGCSVDVLYLIKDKMTAKRIEEKIIGSDIIYVGGGNTLNMMNRWKRLGVDKVMLKAYRKGIVLSGLSAGAICWFRHGTSNSRPKLGKRNHGYIKVQGLGFIPLIASPHHVTEARRKDALINVLKRTPGVGIALDDCSALEVIDNRYRIIASKRSAGAHKVYFSSGKLHYERIKKHKQFRPLGELTSF